MPDDNRIMRALGAAIDEINTTLPADRKLDKAADTPLMGAGGRLDSMGLVNLVVAAEEAIEGEFGASVNLGDSRAMSETPSPFRSIGSLGEYVARLLREQGHG
jgi:D-alanine--poly(phosphoribitol) ligase subunit 2